MRIFLIAVTIAIFAYALGLVLQNPDELPVNLLLLKCQQCAWVYYFY